MNYLILTPDGVGSTYLQRSLTVFLNSAGLDYTNTHEIAAGLELYNNNIVKIVHKVPRGPDYTYIRYGQPLERVIQLLENNTGSSLVSRLAHYVMKERAVMAGKKAGGTREWYPFLNRHYQKIFYCTRDPFEYALSWGIRDTNKIRNVFSVDEHRNNVKDENYKVDLNLFNKKLKMYLRYKWWVDKYFPTAIEVDYNEFAYNTDHMLWKLTGLEHEMKGISFDEYNKTTYNLSNIGVDNIGLGSLLKSIRFEEYISSLVKQKRLLWGVPLKMNTLLDKRNKIENFSECVDRYNEWCKESNYYQRVTTDILEERIERENKFYGNLSR